MDGRADEGPRTVLTAGEVSGRRRETVACEVAFVYFYPMPSCLWGERQKTSLICKLLLLVDDAGWLRTPHTHFHGLLIHVTRALRFIPIV